MKTIPSNRRGSALLITLAIMLLLTIGAMVAVDTAHTDMELSFNTLHKDQAFYVAEAGLNQAFVQLNIDNEWRTGYVGVEFGEGEYSVAIVDSSVMPALADTILIRSTGVMCGGCANTEALVVPEYLYPFSYALFGDEHFEMDNNTCTDSYRSDSGSFAETYLDSLADVGSNGDVVLTNGSLVGGDAVSALEPGVTMINNSAVTGDTVSGVEPVDFDLISADDFAYAESVNSAPDGFVGSGYEYDSTDGSLLVKDNETLTLSGGIYYFSDITVGNCAHIDIPPGETVTIYMTGNLMLAEACEVNGDGDPPQLLIFSSGDSLLVGESTVLRAAFYGPDVSVLVDNNSNLYGSILANDITMLNNACFHYDRALAEVPAKKTGEMYVIAWRER